MCNRLARVSLSVKCIEAEIRQLSRVIPRVGHVRLRTVADKPTVRVSDSGKGDLRACEALVEKLGAHECVHYGYTCADYAEPHFDKSVKSRVRDGPIVGRLWETYSQMKFCTMAQVPSVGMLFMPFTTTCTLMRLITHTLLEISASRTIRNIRLTMIQS